MFCWCGFVCCTRVIIAYRKHVCSLEALNPDMIKVAKEMPLLFGIGDVITA
jgi:hypothetical protein